MIMVSHSLIMVYCVRTYVCVYIYIYNCMYIYIIVCIYKYNYIYIYDKYHGFANEAMALVMPWGTPSARRAVSS